MIDNNVLFIALTTIAVSYGWGMRGTLCGGEQGALLPGAFLGFLFAAFSPSPVISGNILIFTVIGACAMFFGGDMTYGETLSFSLYKKPKDPVSFNKGMTGVFTKGALWFSLTAGFLGIGVGTMNGTYSWKDILILFAIVPFVRLITYKFFNKPHDKNSDIRPTIYFSATRQEIWGKQLGFVAAIFTMMLIKNDIYSIKLMFFGFLGGSFGWIVGLLFFHVITRKTKDGKLLLGKAAQSGFIAGWKTMEITLGAFSGLVFSIGAVLTNDSVKNLTQKAPSAQDLYPDLFKILPWIMVALFLVDLSQHLFKIRPKKSSLESEYNRKFISEKEYKICQSRLDDPKYGVRSDKFDSFFEIFEKPAYAYIPLILVLLGSTQSARIAAGFMLLIVAVERLCADRFIHFKNKVTISIIFSLICISILIAGEFILPNGFSNLAIWIMLCIEYEICQLYFDFRPSMIMRKRKEYNSLCSAIFLSKSTISMHSYYFVVLAFMIWTGVKYF